MVVRVVCLSASNIEWNRAQSASTRACELVKTILTEQRADLHAEVEIVPLVDYELKSCRMCGQCFAAGQCSRDPAFNLILNKMISADGLFLVCPHYAPIPSKVMILLEKLEEMVFLKSCADQNYRSGLFQKPTGIIAHGGQPETALPYYKTALLEPLAAAFRSVQVNVIGKDRQWPDGAAFGIKSITLPEKSLFVRIEHDWEAIREQIQPLVLNVAGAICQAVATAR